MSKPIPVLETQLNGLRVRFREVPKVLFIFSPKTFYRYGLRPSSPTTRDHT